MSETKKERNKKIVEMIQSGSSYNELGRLFNISPQRIKVIWEREAKKKIEIQRHKIRIKNSKI